MTRATKFLPSTPSPVRRASPVRAESGPPSRPGQKHTGKTKKGPPSSRAVNSSGAAGIVTATARRRLTGQTGCQANPLRDAARPDSC